jgi:hypothetical protein
MNREEFFTKAVIELSAAMMAQPGAWKLQLDKAVQAAQYLTDQIYGEHNAKDGFTAIVAP